MSKTIVDFYLLYLQLANLVNYVRFDENYMDIGIITYIFDFLYLRGFVVGWFWVGSGFVVELGLC